MATSHEVEVALGRRFVDALSAKNTDGLAAIFDPQVDFRGLTPGNDWHATSPAGVVEIVLGSWFEPTDHVREVVYVEEGRFADRVQLRYRLRVENDEGMFVVEQQGYFSAERGSITRMSVVCSGFRPENGAGP
ncbi:MAG: hypothetical protein QOI81_1675 [Actinomycetota bacterium]|nr:hypothetical protein [Actinomycetota bacterium]